MPRLLRIGGCVSAAAAVALAVWFGVRSHAEPHAALVSSYPADQAALTQPPAEIDLAFTNPVDLSLSHVSVLDRSGTAVTAGQPRLVTPERLRQRVRTTDIGEVTVAYHVTFVNRAELAGTIRFDVGNQAATQRVTAGRPSAAQAEDAAAEDIAAQDAAAGAGHQHGVDPVSAALLVLDGLVAIGVIVLLRVRPRPNLPDREHPAQHDRAPLTGV